MNFISKWIEKLLGISPDPARECQLYREVGCDYVDDFHCDIRSCVMLDDYKKSKE